MNTHRVLLVLVALCAFGLCAPVCEAKGPKARHARLYTELGNYSRELTTVSPEARRYFTQGLLLAYRCDHTEAARSFREAAWLDPQCALCWWGVALVLGPNIRQPMPESAVAEAWSASRRALAVSRSASPVEQALIGALTKRYAEHPAVDRSALDTAYADAMREVARQFFDDPDVLALYADAVMNRTAGKYRLAGN